jgi:hypothetical protein
MALPVPIDPGDVAQAVAERWAPPIHLLQNPDWLEREFLMRLGLNDEVLEEFPSAFYPWCGQGVKLWQYPRQFSRYLCLLADKQIRSYVETSSRHICSRASVAGRKILYAGKWDLALIDGEHSRTACWPDYQSFKDNTRVIVAHDIVNENCPKVSEIWRNIHSVVPPSRVLEQTDRYREVFEQTGKRFLGIDAVVFD